MVEAEWNMQGALQDLLAGLGLGDRVLVLAVYVVRVRIQGRVFLKFAKG